MIEYSTPLVTVYIPVFNGEKFVVEAVTSVLNQTYTNFELIIVNDGSTDHTLQLLKNLDDNRIKLIDLSENKGNCYAANIALRQARGKYIIRMDADDISFPNRIEEQVVYMESNPEVVLSGASMKLISANSDKSEVWKYPKSPETAKAAFIFKCGVMQPISIVRTETIHNNQLFYDESNRDSYAEDYDLFYRISKLGKLGNIDKVLLYYRRHESNLTVTTSLDKAKKLRSAIYLTVLKDMGFDEQAIDLDAHLGLRRLLPEDFEPEFVLRIFDWSKKLREMNSKTGYFDQNALDQTLLDYEDQLFYKISQKGRKYIQAYKKRKPLNAVQKRYWVMSRVNRFLGR